MIKRALHALVAAAFLPISVFAQAPILQAMPLSAQTTNGGYCLPFSVEKQKAGYVCTNALDSKDTFMVTKAADPETYMMLANMKPGEKLVANPKTKEMRVMTPAFSQKAVRAYADTVIVPLAAASVFLSGAQESVKDEKVFGASGLIPIVDGLSGNVDKAIKAADDILNIPPALPASVQKRRALGHLEELEASLKSAVSKMDTGIAAMKALSSLMKAKVRVQVKAEAKAQAQKELDELVQGIRQAQAVRDFAAQQERNIRMFRTLHGE